MLRRRAGVVVVAVIEEEEEEKAPAPRRDVDRWSVTAEREAAARQSPRSS
jgi:hypothetical protein